MKENRRPDQKRESARGDKSRTGSQDRRGRGWCRGGRSGRPVPMIGSLGGRRKGPGPGRSFTASGRAPVMRGLMTVARPSPAPWPGGHRPSRRAGEGHCGSGPHRHPATFFVGRALDPYCPPSTSLGVPEFGVHRPPSPPAAAALSARAARRCGVYPVDRAGRAVACTQRRQRGNDKTGREGFPSRPGMARGGRVSRSGRSRGRRRGRSWGRSVPRGQGSPDR